LEIEKRTVPRRFHVDRQVVRNEAAGHDVEPLFARHAVVDQLVVGIE